MSAPTCVCCGRPTPDGYACHGCATKAAGRLATIAELAPDARLVAAGLVRRGGAGGSGKPGSRPPLNDGATDAVHEVQNTLTTLARDIVETRGLPTPAVGPVDPVIVAAYFLATQVEWMRHAVDGPEPYAVRAFAEIAESAGRIKGVVNGPSEQRFLGPCGADPECTGLAARWCPRHGDCACPDQVPMSGTTHLSGPMVDPDCALHSPTSKHPLPSPCDGDIYARDGASSGRCRTCGAEVSADLRRAWLDDEVRAHAFTARDIADAHGINVKTIRTWATRGALASYWRTEGGLVTPWVDTDDEDEIQARGGRLHYVGDVLDLAAADTARRAGQQATRARRAAARAESEHAA